MFGSIGSGIRKVVGGVGDIVAAPFDMADEIIDGESREEREARIRREIEEQRRRERS